MSSISLGVNQPSHDGRVGSAFASRSKVVGLNPAGSNSERLVSLTCIDGNIMSDKYDMEFPNTISGAPEVVS